MDGSRCPNPSSLGTMARCVIFVHRMWNGRRPRENFIDGRRVE